MSRGGPALKRELGADPVYSNVLVTQFINSVMLHGKKSLAEDVVYDALKIISEKTGGDPTQVLRKAIDNVRPVLEIRSRRVGGSTLQVPVEIAGRRGTTLAIRWVVSFSRARRENSMSKRLAGEILEASENEGASIKKREDVHKMAEANKAFAHFKW